MKQTTPNKFVVILIIGMVIIGITLAVYLNSKNIFQKIGEQILETTSPLHSSPLLIAPSPLSTPQPFSSTITLNSSEFKKLKDLFTQGIQLYQDKQYESAKKIFDEMLPLDPDNPTIYDARATVYVALGDNQKALNDYSKAIELDQFFAQAYYNRGRVYISLKQYDKALTDLQKTLELDVFNFGYRANGNIGLIYHQQSQYDKALEAYTKAISSNPIKADTYFLRGETYTLQQNYEAAIVDYQTAITHFPNYTEAYQSLGYAYYKTNQFAKAGEALSKALSIAPSNPTAHLYQTLVFVATDDFDRAKAEVNPAINSMGSLSKEKQTFIISRVLTELNALAQKKSSQEIEIIIKMIPNPK